MITITPTAGGTERGLLLPRADLRAKIASWIEVDRVPELTDYYDSAQRTMGAFPVPARIESPPPRIGQLFWPVIGAARYAHALYLIDGYTLGQLQGELGASNAVTIAYYDGDFDAARLFPMFILAVRPFVQTAIGARPTVEPAIDDAWVLVCVDARYYWQHETSTGQAVDWVPGSWTELLSALRGGIGLAPALTIVDSPEGAYGFPTARWRGGRLEGHSLPHLLDAAAAAIGSRIVVTPSAFELQRPTAAAQTALTTEHVLAIADNRLSAGGLLFTSDILLGMEDTARVYFYDGSNPTCPDTARIDIATGGFATGAASAWLDMPSSTDVGARNLAAQRWALDWAAWQDVPLDAGYNGILDVIASGYLDHVLIYHDDHTAYTKYARPPVSYSSLYADGWTCLDIPQYPPDVCGSGSGDANSGCIPAPDICDGGDTEEIYDIQCVEGVLIVTRGQVAHVQTDGRIRHYWCDLYDTIEGCCVCPTGPITSGGSGIDIDIISGSLISGSGACTSVACPQCPDGAPLFWRWVYVQSGGPETCPFLTAGTYTLTYAPTAGSPCRWTGNMGVTGFIVLVYDGEDDIWYLFVEDVTETKILAVWSLSGAQFRCMDANTLHRVGNPCSSPFIPTVLTSITPDLSVCNPNISACNDDLPASPQTKTLTCDVPAAGCTKTLNWVIHGTNEGWWSGGGCAGAAAIQVRCVNGIWQLSTDATDPGCGSSAGMATTYDATSGTLVGGDLLFRAPKCLFTATGTDATIVDVHVTVDP